MVTLKANIKFRAFFVTLGTVNESFDLPPLSFLNENALTAGITYPFVNARGVTLSLVRT